MGLKRHFFVTAGIRYKRNLFLTKLWQNDRNLRYVAGWIMNIFPLMFNPRTCKQSLTPNMVQGLGSFFRYVTVFWKDLPLVGSLWCALQDEIYIMVAALLGSLWNHPRWLPKIRNINQKSEEIEKVWSWTYKMCRNQTFCSFLSRFCAFLPKRLQKMHFFQKWLDHLLLKTSFVVTMATDSHWTCIRLYLRHMHTATENGRCRWLFVLEKFKENFTGLWHPPASPLLHAHG